MSLPGTGSPGEVFGTFLKLGLTSFGGPIAHIGYFRRAFVLQRGWIGESDFADLVAVGQFLPGPASSQVAFALGLRRAGLGGAFAAWAGFTLPSALLLLAFALLADSLRLPAAAIHGLGLVAVAVVAQAVWGMAASLAPDLRRRIIALLGAAVLLLLGGAWGQVAAILLGAAAGWLACRGTVAAGSGDTGLRLSPRFGAVCLLVFALLLLVLPMLAPFAPALAVANGFYRSGALVFGGGHVVLPLLHDAVVAPGWISQRDFLAGYGAAQAVPGPLFTVAAFLGARLHILPPLAGAVIALVAIFLPGQLILLGALPFWDRLRKRVGAQATMRGINAAVLGILAAALYDPLWTSAIFGWRDFLLALAGFLLLTLARCPPLLVVIAMTAAAMAVA